MGQIIEYMRRMLLASVACIPVLSGCTYEKGITRPDTGRQVTFSINIPGRSVPDTRALGDGEENEVQTIEMLLFDPNSGEVVGNPVFANNISTDADDIRKKTFTVRLPEGTFDAMIFANARKVFNDAGVIASGDGREETLAKLTTTMPASGWATNPADADKKYLIPMWGMKENLTVGQGTSISGIWLHRMLSRIDLSVTGDDAFTGYFKLKDIKLHNVQKEGRIAPATANWNAAGKINGTVQAGLATAPSLVAGCGVHPAISYAGAIVGEKSCTGEMYLFEAPKAAAHADPNAPFLTVKGEFNGAEGWYRIDLADYSDMTYLDVLRNHLYKIRIEKVSRAGFPDEGDAIANRGDNIVVDITLWNEYDLGGTVFDGQHFLSINPQDVEFTHALQSASLTVKTDLDSEISLSGIKVSGSPSDPGAALADGWISNLSLTPQGVVNGKNVYALAYDVAQNNAFDARTGYIYVKCGRLTNVVRVAQTGVPGTWDVPSVSASVPAAGGETAPLTLDAYPGRHYTVEIESVSGTDHFAWVAETSGGAKYSKLQPRETTEPFVVGFPKMIYPNLDNSLTATVRVTMVESGESKTFQVTQAAPTQKRVDILNVGTSWGRLSGDGSNSTFTASWSPSYNAQWVYSYRDNFGSSGTVKTNGPLRLASSVYGGNLTTVWNAVKGTVNFVHLTEPYAGNTTAQTELWNWVNGAGSYAGNEGLLFVNAETTGSNAAQTQSGTILNWMGLQTVGKDTETYGLSTAENRVMEYITETGPFGPQSTGSWTTAGNTSHILISTMATDDGMVPVLVSSANSNWCSLMIDAKRRIVVKTDSEMVDGSPANEVGPAMKNVQAWTINTAQYGTHFSDYFWDSDRVQLQRTLPTPQP